MTVSCNEFTLRGRSVPLGRQTREERRLSEVKTYYPSFWRSFDVLRSIFIALLLLASSPSWAQSEAERLQVIMPEIAEIDEALLANDLERAQALADRMFEKYEAQGDELGMARALSRMGSVRAAASDEEGSIAFQKRALALLDADQHPESYFAMLYNLGIDYAAESIYDQAFEYQTRARAHAETKGISDWIPYAEFGIARIYINIKDYDGAIDILEPFVERPTIKPAIRAYALIDLASSYQQRGEFDKALIYLERDPNEFADEADNPIDLPDRHSVHAQVLNDMGRHDDAEAQAMELLELSDQLNSERDACLAHIELARVALARGEPIRTLQSLDHASCQFANESEFLRAETDLRILPVRIDALLAVDRVEEAKEATVKLLDIQRLIFEDARAGRIAVAEAQMNLAQREGRIAFLEQQERLQKVTLERRTFLMSTAALSAFIFFGFGVFAFRNYRRQTHANTILQDTVSSQRDRVRKAESDVKYKSLLFHELSHRAKNNFQIIVSLMKLHKRHIGPTATQATLAILNDVTGRLETMAVVQRSLDEIEDEDLIHAKPFITNLVHQLADMSGCMITVNTTIEDVYLDTKSAGPLALIINELVSNAIKYAFTEGDGQLDVELSDNGSGQLQLLCSDDGPGFPEHLDLDQVESFGLQIVRNLAEQIEGVARIQIRPQGATVSVNFPALDSKSNKGAHHAPFPGGGSNDAADGNHAASQ
jgi:two-component sensor histidine kinase